MFKYCWGGGSGIENNTYANLTKLWTNEGSYFREGVSALGNPDPYWSNAIRGFAVGGALGTNLINLSLGNFYALSSEATVNVHNTQSVVAGYNSGMVTGTGTGDITDFIGMYGFLIPTALLGYSGDITNAIAMKGAMSDFNGNVTENAYGGHVGIDAGWKRTYGYYIANVGGNPESERRGFIDDDNHDDAHSSLRRDDKYWLWGEDEDVGIGFNGTHMIINSSFQGTDYPVFVTGNLTVDNNINVAGCVVYNGGTLGTCV